MNTTEAFKQYQKNKFYNSIKKQTTELGFDPKYLPQEKDRTNFGYKLDWENKTKEVEYLLSKNGLEVYLVNSKNDPILTPNPHTPERPVGSQSKPGISYEKTYRTKRIKKSRTDFALYNNIKNYYESNNRFFDFTKKRVVKNSPVYDVIESVLDLRIDILSSKECIINGGSPSINNFSYMLFGGNSSSDDPITVEEWCATNQPNYY
jgi:hypothetical protein